MQISQRPLFRIPRTCLNLSPPQVRLSAWEKRYTGLGVLLKTPSPGRFFAALWSACQHRFSLHTACRIDSLKHAVSPKQQADFRASRHLALTIFMCFGIVGQCKTEASQKPVPVHPILFPEGIKQGYLTHKAYEVSEPRVRLYGNVALVTAKVHNAGTFGGKSFDVMERETDVWLWKDGNWKCVLTHEAWEGAEKTQRQLTD